ncbi:MAG: hypothetical protein LBF27_27285 [Sphingobacterium sp.]|nr:hypothetical protein [Sphingobacterium sp.]
MSIAIACLGLFGVITFAIQLRIKEIGIRKTLGATLSNLVYLLCSDMVKLVGIALLIALPLGWLLRISGYKSSLIAFRSAGGYL